MTILDISEGLVDLCFQTTLSFETVLELHMHCSRLRPIFGQPSSAGRREKEVRLLLL